MYLNPKHKEKLSKIIKRLDSSFYFYDLDFLESHLNNINSLKENELKLWYATKSNPLSAVLKVIRNLGIGVDVAAQGELDQVLRAGVLPSSILSTGPSKSRKYLKSLLENEIRVIVLESVNQAKWLDHTAKEMGITANCLIRVQLDWEEGKDILGGNSITPFGIEPSTWIKANLGQFKNLNILGPHVFQWGNVLSEDRLITIWKKILENMDQLSKDLKIPFQIVDLGGGLGIPYSNSEKSLDFSILANALKGFRKEFKLKEIWMELGRYIVGECGHYFSQVIDRKHVRGKDLLVLDGGINHIARPALTGQSFPCELFRNSKTNKKSFQVHGPLCTALDVLGTFDLPEDINEGDWLVFSQAGAYGFTEAMPFFLCHNLPAEVIMYKESLMTPRTIKTSADWMI